MTAPGGTLTLADDLTLSRVGYGTMRLPGPGVWGPPADRDAALAVLREAVALGVTHLDTAAFYGPDVANDLVREALHPYPADLRIITKIGFTRTPDRAWVPANSADELRAQVHENLEHLGVDALDVVNLRAGTAVDGRSAGPVERPFEVLAGLQQEGLVRHLGVSTVTADELAAARAIAPVVCVQNEYNLAHRGDDDLVDLCAAAGIAYVPYFPLGGFSPLQAGALDDVAARLGASPQQVALAWLLHRSPTVLVIPGTSSVAHLRENVAAADLELDADALAALDAVG
jgi:pyridoxine 4-dehydrogenase